MNGRLSIAGTLASFFLYGLFAGAVAQPRAKERPPGSDRPSIDKPSVFGPGIISTGEFDSHPTFTPDGKTVYFVRSTPGFNLWTILYSHSVNGRWSEPKVAPFSGRYSDADPFITADGRRLYFISNRPSPGKTTRDLDIWFVERMGEYDWGNPQNIGPPINSPGSEWYPTLTKTGVLYFGSDRPGGKGRTDLYRSRLVGDRFADPENLGEPINTQFNEFEPYISPDERFLIFMGGGRADGRGGFDLYLTYSKDGKWTTPVDLGDKINSPGNEYSPTISPDGRYFFWTSTRVSVDTEWRATMGFRDLMRQLQSPGNGLGDIYQIDIHALGIAN